VPQVSILLASSEPLERQWPRDPGCRKEIVFAGWAGTSVDMLGELEAVGAVRMVPMACHRLRAYELFSKVSRMPVPLGLSN
jgi:hypothetical protein